MHQISPCSNPQPFSGPTASLPSSLSIETAFSPEQGATDLVVKTIASAKAKIRVASYSFTSQPVTDALIAAHDKGVEVELVADGSDRKGRGTKISQLAADHIPTRYNDQFAIMHDKFIIIDDQTVELGSFNYTSAAEHKNAENVLVLHDVPDIAKRYSTQWQIIWDGGTQQ